MTRAGWRKSSYSSDSGGNCVEAGNIGHGVAVRDTTDREGPVLAFTPKQWRSFLDRVTAWRKSSYSGSGGDNCVEAGNIGHGVAVRDTTDREGPVLAFTPKQWRSFLGRVKTR